MAIICFASICIVRPDAFCWLKFLFFPGHDWLKCTWAGESLETMSCCFPGDRSGPQRFPLSCESHVKVGESDTTTAPLKRNYMQLVYCWILSQEWLWETLGSFSPLWHKNTCTYKLLRYSKVYTTVISATKFSLFSIAIFIFPALSSSLVKFNPTGWGLEHLTLNLHQYPNLKWQKKQMIYDPSPKKVIKIYNIR